MRTLSRSVLAVASALALVAACGGGNNNAPAVTSPTTTTSASDVPTTPASTDASTSASTEATSDKLVGPPDVKWADMDPKQKGKFMGAVVMPRMKELFTEFDAKTFADFSCMTCHGADAKDRQFKMPNPGIAVLPEDKAGFMKLMKEKPTWMKFMAEKVKPEMAKLLALPEYDVKSPPPQPGTMGCGNCHTMKK